MQFSVIQNLGLASTCPELQKHPEQDTGRLRPPFLHISGQATVLPAYSMTEAGREKLQWNCMDSSATKLRICPSCFVSNRYPKPTKTRHGYGRFFSQPTCLISSWKDKQGWDHVWSGKYFFAGLWPKLGVHVVWWNYGSKGLGFATVYAFSLQFITLNMHGSLTALWQVWRFHWGSVGIIWQRLMLRHIRPIEHKIKTMKIWQDHFNRSKI